MTLPAIISITPSLVCGNQSRLHIEIEKIYSDCDHFLSSNKTNSRSRGVMGETMRDVQDGVHGQIRVNYYKSKMT